MSNQSEPSRTPERRDELSQVERTSDTAESTGIYFLLKLKQNNILETFKYFLDRRRNVFIDQRQFVTNVPQHVTNVYQGQTAEQPLNGEKFAC